MKKIIYISVLILLSGCSIAFGQCTTCPAGKIGANQLCLGAGLAGDACNRLYSTGGGATSLPLKQIGFGNGTAIVSSPYFSWDSTENQLNIYSKNGGQATMQLWSPWYASTDPSPTFESHPRGWMVLRSYAPSQIGLNIENPNSVGRESVVINAFGGGIGTGYGTAQIGIVGTASEVGLYLNNTGTSGSQRNIFVTNNASGAGANNFIIANSSVGRMDFKIDGNGYGYFPVGLNISNAYTMPTADGTSGYIMSTNGSGTVSWIPNSIGTVTSVGMTAPAWLTVSGSPITTSGTLGLTLTSGYYIPTTSDTNKWNISYRNRITSLTTTGNSGASTLSSNVLNVPNYTIAGLATGTTAQYYRGDGSLAAFPSIPSGTVTSVTSANGAATITNTTTTPVITIVSAPILTTARNIEGVSFNGSADIAVQDDLLIMQGLGNSILDETMPLIVDGANAGVNLTSGALNIQEFRAKKSQTITGIEFIQVTQGSYTSTGYNGIGIYTYNTGTGAFTLADSTTTSSTIWKGVAGIQSIALAATYPVTAGTMYYIGFIWQSSATTTAPQVGERQLLTGVSGGGFTNSAKIYSYILSKTSLPASGNMSGTTVSNFNFWFGFY